MAAVGWQARSDVALLPTRDQREPLGRTGSPSRITPGRTDFVLRECCPPAPLDTVCAIVFGLERSHARQKGWKPGGVQCDVAKVVAQASCIV